MTLGKSKYINRVVRLLEMTIYIYNNRIVNLFGQRRGLCGWSDMRSPRVRTDDGRRPAAGGVGGAGGSAEPDFGLSI